MSTMARVVAERIGRVGVTEALVPAPGPGEALVHTALAGICGSDTHAVAGHHPLLTVPYFPGHEATGTVVEVGPGVTFPAVGQRVILKPSIVCGTCVNCRAGRTNACQELRWIGCDPSGALPGAMADYVVAPAGNLYVVPDEVTDSQAVLVECLATPVHAARIAGDLSGLRVVVLGVGTIGLFAVLAARRAGAGTIVVTDLDAQKRERALRHGADGAVDAVAEGFADAVQAGLGGPADVVFDCVANERSVLQSVSVLRRSGTLLVVGVPPRDFSLPMPLVQDWELRIQGCANYTEEDVVTALGMAQDLPADDIISDRFPFAEAVAAFERAAQNTSGKVVVGPKGGN